MTAQLEHANITVSDAQQTAAWMEKIFGWHIRWQGEVLNGAGHSIHVGGKDSYLALYTPGHVNPPGESSYDTVSGLNHLAVVVEDLDATEAAILDHGFKTESHADYEPGRRFYFHDDDDIQYEVVADL